MKLELALLCQSIEVMQIELIRLRAIAADLLADSVASTLPPAPPEPIAPSPSARAARPHRYGPGELEQRVLSILAHGEPMAFAVLVQTAQAERPGTAKSSVSSALRLLVAHGQVRRPSYGIYQLTERKPHLSVVPS